MKNWKQSVFFGMVAIIAFVFALVACDDGNGKDDPKDQSQEVTLTLGTETPTATVKGHFTDTEWDGVADKIKNAINGLYVSYVNTSGDDLVPSIFRGIFNRGVTITVEKTPSGYSKWKTTTDGKTIYLAFDKLDNDLQETINSAVEKLYDNEADNG
jgi:hypothetical protein